MARKGKGGHGKGMTAQTGGSGHKTNSQSKGKAKYTRKIQQVNLTNRDEFIRSRRLLLACGPQIDEYTELRALFDDIVNLRITAEEAEARAGGRSPQELLHRLAELTEFLQKVSMHLSKSKHVKNQPNGRKAKTASILRLDKDGGTANAKDN